MPTDWQPAELALPQHTEGMLYITVHADSLAPVVVRSVDLLLAVGKAPEKTIEGFCQASGQKPPLLQPVELAAGEALVWRPRAGRPRSRAQ